MKIVRLTESDLSRIIEKVISEDDYSSVANILRGGIRKSIKTIAILTAENPFGEKADKNYNKEMNSNLESFLRMGKFGYRKVKGSYGSKENSFIVNNISRDTAIDIGAKFKQDSIVYGEVVNIDSDDMVSMSFEMISTNPQKPNIMGQAIAKNDVFVNRNKADDFYTEVGGRKFVIPFFGTLDRIKEPDKKIYDIEKDYSKTKWEGGDAIPTSITKTLVKQDLDELNYLGENALKTVGSTAYNYRSRLYKKLKELDLTNLL